MTASLKTTFNEKKLLNLYAQEVCTQVKESQSVIAAHWSTHLPCIQKILGSKEDINLNKVVYAAPEVKPEYLLEIEIL